MFTGLIEEIGKVLWLRATDRGTELQIAAGHSPGRHPVRRQHRDKRLLPDRDRPPGRTDIFDLLEETLDRTNLKKLRRDSLVNLERPLSAAGRLGGHFVQGHIDCSSPDCFLWGQRAAAITAWK